MIRFVACCLFLIIAAPALARDTPGAPEALRIERSDGALLHSTTTGAALLARESAGPDTFDLYGGPRDLVRDPDGVAGSGDEYVEGKFETPDGSPAGLSVSPGDWTGDDLTERPVFWRVSEFNAANLNGNGAGNLAMWCGLDADDPLAAGWTDAPGYGNNWNQRLVYEEVVADPSVGQTVDLDFFFNVDTEVAYDFVRVEYFVGSTFLPQTVYEFAGTTSFAVPGTRFADVATGPITYAADDYFQGDRIRIVIEFGSDGAYSDEDGLDPSDGAIQLDDIVLTTSSGTFVEDFEGPGPYLFAPERDPFFGDFANVFTFTSDLDPCAENRTPQLNFVDRGQAPPNGPGVTGIVSTGGTTWEDWSYGTPGAFVLNWLNGISGGGGLYLHNAAVSPPIDWDLPGAADDDPDVVGAVLAFDVWSHLPFEYPFFWFWNVRSRVDGVWGEWRGDNFLLGGDRQSYLRFEADVTQWIDAGAEQIQIRLAVEDLSPVIFFVNPGATPAPWFDNVRLSKYRVGGPSLSTRTRELANDAFPVSGAIDASTPAARDLLDVRFDRAQSIGGDFVVPGDSVTIDVEAVIAGTSVSEVRMRWALRQNPFFEAAIRQVPSRPGVDTDFATGTTVDGRPTWTGTVIMDNAVTSGGSIVTNRWAADLPDEDFLYPGDVLHYYFEAVDDAGRVTTLPTDVRGFGAWDDLGRSTFSRTYTVRALPSVGAEGAPDILWINDAGRRGHEEEWITALEALGLVEGRDFDSYTVQGAASGVGNGIGAAGRDSGLGKRRGHGASVDQLSTYATLLYESDDLRLNVLGTGNPDDFGDPSADIPLLSAWKEAPGDRASVWFGDSFVSGAQETAAGQAFVAMMLNAGALGDDLQATAPGVTNPAVVPSGFTPGFAFEFDVVGSCPRGRRFDDLRPGSLSFVSHQLRRGDGSIDQDLALGVVYDRTIDGDRRLDVTFPFGLSTMSYPDQAGGSALPARAVLLEEVLRVIDGSFAPGVAIDAPGVRVATLSVAPTPFNPSTVVTFALPHVGAQASVRVYDVRGQLVRTLHDGASASAELSLTWNGRDDRGAVVGSGVYFVRGVTAGFDQTRKVMLVK